ncbi:DUF7144 family membrane protein [Actinoplanes sp. CA-252034]|uniref:DUF7144 family membrane protein n=1 Tax=Actinoplanes sp. CA-252034 TaxID=3239906 RepID=UPI003D953A2C
MPTTEDTDLAGVVTFAGVMLLVLGAFQSLEGLTTLLRDSAYLITADGALIEPDPAVWGWSHLALGAVSVAAGAGILHGRAWARAVGVVLASVAAIAHFLLLATAPLWCTVLICVEIVVVFALCRRPA